MLPAEEADMYRSAVIRHEAYSPLETNIVLFPGPFPPNILELSAQGLKEQAREPNVFCFKVVDTELEGEQMISFDRWYVIPRRAACIVIVDRCHGLIRDNVDMLTNLGRTIYDDDYPPKP